ncbi:hypothetical protein Ocin01_07859 [Orchesella cincta]|uniref:Uncharacterized protein n=1 Tax=Orchesella cincta TaxID=48709 RepID=A0A1D2N182_ORCCI|nr:hypothetical protein Ocin01_07859 [Orchesella cincta]
MAQSHRTASLNRFSGLPVNDLHGHSHHPPHHSSRASTARHTKKFQPGSRGIVSQQKFYEPDERLSTPGRRPMTRCVTPISMHASEAHIHRIRSAASHAEFKHQCKVATSLTHVPTQSHQKSNHRPSNSEEDDADVESVDWSSPLDITTYLYKKEYVISSKKDGKKRFNCLSNSIASTEKGSEELLNAALQPENISEEINPANDEMDCMDKNNTDTMKADIIADYIKSSKTRKETDKVEFHRKVQDCVKFIKHVNNDIRDMKTETKRLEELHSPRVKPWIKESREEIISRGYTILKRIYELNSELTEAAAKKHVTGPPGNHWMGLSRVEVIEIMRRIHKEFGVPRNKQNDIYLEYGTSSKRSLQNGRHSHRRNTKKGKDKKRNSKSQVPRTPKVRASQMMPVHVPGPPHLHTNICIRPWEPQQDGWSQDDEVASDLEEMYNMRHYSSPKSFHEDNYFIAENHNSEAAQNPTAPPPTSMYSPPSSPEDDECPQTKEWAGEDYVTLEIFNPVFRISR